MLEETSGCQIWSRCYEQAREREGATIYFKPLAMLRRNIISPCPDCLVGSTGFSTATKMHSQQQQRHFAGSFRQPFLSVVHNTGRDM